MNNDKIYNHVNERIIGLLEKGVAPWKQSWQGGKRKPATNLVSKKQYRGINFLLLNSLGYKSSYWLTYKQAQERGGNVKKGEKGTPIVFWKILSFKDKKESGEQVDKTIPLLRESYVFNIEQCEGLKVDIETGATLLDHNPIKACEEIRAKFPLGMAEIRHDGGAIPFYNPRLDYINLPALGLFESAEQYYQTLYHEVIHSTGHKARLNRSTLTEIHYWGDENYSQEELVAELGASYLACLSGIDNSTINSSASYLNSWIRALKNDNKLLLKSAGLAQKAVDYLVGIEEKE